MHMITACIVLADPLGLGTLDLVIPLAEGYGLNRSGLFGELVT